MSEKVLIIGIDPDCDKNGVAVWDAGKRAIELKALNFFQLYDFLKSQREKIKVVKIEAGWMNDVSNYHEAKSKSIAARIGKNVGANHEAGRKIVEMCEYLGLPYREVKPLQKLWGRTGKEKISHDELNGQLSFKRIPAIVGRTNQEQRDAALVCLLM